MAENVERFTFTAELTAERGDEVWFSYVIDQSAEVLLPRTWWEGMGSPRLVAVTVEPEAA